MRARLSFLRRPSWRELLFVLLLIVVGGVLRLLSLERFPPGLQGDEAWMGLEAQRILRDGWIGIWSPTGWGQPAGTFYWTALLFSFLPDTTVVLRASAALLGVVTIPVFYLFVRTLYGATAAAIATLLLAFSYWHMHYSRTAFSLISAPLVEGIVLLLLAQGIKQRRPWPFVASGVAAGLGVYTYRGYVFFALLLVAVWGVILLRRPYAVKRLAMHAVLFAIPALLLAIPMLHFVATRYDDFMGYGRVVSIFRSEEFKKASEQGEMASYAGAQIGRAVAVYYYGGKADFTDGMGAKPLLDPLTAGLFTLGLGISLSRWRQWEHLLILGGVVVGIVSVATTLSWGENRRGIAALPMVFAAAGVGGEGLATAARSLLKRFAGEARAFLHQGLLYSCLVALTLFVALGNVPLYFRKVATSEIMRFAYAYELSRASAYLRTFVEEKPYVYFYSPRWAWDYEARRFQAPGLAGEHRSREFGQFSLERRPEHGDVVYLMMPPYDQHMAEVMSHYPGGEYIQAMEGDRVIFVAYHLGSP